MAAGPLRVVDYVRRLAGGAGADGHEDAQLLGRYAAGGDEAAFAALVRRYGPLVWGVCRRMLPSPQDAEDAFQATFLVLARKARALKPPGRLGPWLHAVAFRTAARGRARLARRQARERAVEAPAWAPADASADARDLRQALDEEMSRLPERFRAPLVLCYLEGLTNEEAAQRLGCPKGTVLSRLARGRQRLRDRLARRGLAPSAGLPPLPARPAPPAALLESTPRLGAAFAAAGAASTPVTALAQGVLHGMFLTKVKFALALALTLGVVAAGAGLLAGRPADRPAPPRKPREPGPAAGAKGRPAEPKGKKGRAASARELREILRRPIDFKGFDDPKVTLAEALAALARLYGVTFDVNDRAFSNDRNPLDDAEGEYGGKVRITARSPIPPMKAPLEVVLRKVLARIPGTSGATFLIRESDVEITTNAAAREELGIEDSPVNPALLGMGLGGAAGVPGGAGVGLGPRKSPPLRLVWEVLENVPLAKALRQLADASGYNLVVDVRVGDKARTAVSARLANVPVDTAVRVLADMAGLGVVRLHNVFYVTSRANAARLREEEKEGKRPAPRRRAPPGGAPLAPKG